MDSMHRNIIMEQSKYLAQATDLQVLLPALRNTKIFTGAMLADIESGSERLYEMLPKRGPDAFDAFLEVLRDSNYSDVALKLEDATKITNRSDWQYYTMESDRRGYCLIINNVNFVGCEPRRGSKKDARRLKNLFEDMGYDVKVVEDQTRDQTLQTLNEFSKRDFQNVDSCVMCILSHGTRRNNLDVFSDIKHQEIYMYEVLYYFNTQNCPQLINKPKMFFVQACRGGKEDFGVAIDAIPEPGAQAIMHAAYCTDMMVVFSTLPKYVSIRHIRKGSWFCSELIKVFRKHAQTMDLVSMVKIVNNNVCKKVTNKGLKQAISTQGYEWYKKLYFNPIATDLTVEPQEFKFLCCFT